MADEQNNVIPVDYRNGIPSDTPEKPETQAPATTQDTTQSATFDTVIALLRESDRNHNRRLDAREIYRHFDNVLSSNSFAYVQSQQPQSTMPIRRITPNGDTMVEDGPGPLTENYTVEDGVIFNRELLIARLTRSLHGPNAEEIAQRIDEVFPRGIENITLSEFLERHPSDEMRLIPRTNRITVGRGEGM